MKYYGTIGADPATRRVPVQRRSFGFYDVVVKRALDVILVLAVALPLLPLLCVLFFVVRRDAGPAFYSQYRVGRNGRLFRLWKFRTMQQDAKARLAQYLAENPEAAVEWHRDQKLRSDPRITVPGRILRKYSLDELPQLWNVLIGDMSIVGPRPIMPEQREAYPGQGYYLLRPGLTGLWQVSDRNKTSFAARAAYDDRYLGCISLATDLSVMLRTVKVVIRGTGV